MSIQGINVPTLQDTVFNISNVTNNISISGGSITGFGVNLDAPLFTGAFVVSGEGGAQVRLANLGGNISGIIVSGGAGGGVSSSGTTVSYFFDFPFTGNNIVETFINPSFVFTGYALGCITTGSSTPPLSGTLYQRGITNTKTTIADFTFESGVLYKASGGFNVTVTGHNRLGIDITNIITGIRDFSIGIFG
jgi:hypothetical protein